MSYEIIYDKQFVKLEREDKPTVFIPMIYGGSNNCFDITYDRLGRRRERRERSWFSFDWVCDGAKYDTMEAMLQRQLEFRNEKAQQDKDSIALHGEYSDKNFGYWASLAIGGATRNTTFGQYQGIVKTGCKNAMTIEELAAENIFLSISTGSSYYSKEKFEAAGFDSFSVTPKTTEEFFTMLEDFLAKTKPHGIPCYLSLDAHENTIKRMRRKTRPQRRKTQQAVQVDTWYTIDIEELGAFVKFTSRGTLYSTYDSGGLKFADKAKALKKLEYVQKKLNWRKYTISLKTHNTPITIWETKYELVEA
ncbi:MAG: hypothetical protein P8J32_04790 [bacterium]|nr:hypothetical protein [bacterium]